MDNEKKQKASFSSEILVQAGINPEELSILPLERSRPKHMRIMVVIFSLILVFAMAFMLLFLMSSDKETGAIISNKDFVTKILEDLKANDFQAMSEVIHSDSPLKNSSSTFDAGVFNAFVGTEVDWATCSAPADSKVAEQADNANETPEDVVYSTVSCTTAEGGSSFVKFDVRRESIEQTKPWHLYFVSLSSSEENDANN